MERPTRRRVWMAWLLTALFVLPSAVRTIHIYEEHRTPQEDSHSTHDCNTCPVCHFSFTIFTEATYAACDFSVAPAGGEPLFLSCGGSYRHFFLLSCPLRAPPAMQASSLCDGRA